MQNYELLFILPGTLTEEEIKPIIASVKETVGANGGNDFKVEDMGKSRLAYPMKHIRYGYFQLAHFTAETSGVNVIEKKLRLLNQLLRVVIRKYDPKKAIQKITFSEQSVALETKPTEEQVFVSAPAVEITSAKAEEDASLNIASSAPAKEEKPKRASKKEKVNLDDIDKKLDQILEIDIDKV